MRKIINYIIVLCSLCFVMDAQAQQANIKLMSLEQKIASLSEKQREAFDEMRNATPSMLSFYDQAETIRDMRDNPKVQVVELHDLSLLAKLKDIQYATDFESAKLLMLRLQDTGEVSIRAEDLSLFKSLRYILLKSYSPIDDTKARQLVQGILQNQEGLSQVEIYYTFIGSEE